MLNVIFLDRDGVINFEPGDYTYQPDKFKIVDGLFESLAILKGKGYQFIVITNQGGISKGIYTHQNVAEVHMLMRKLFTEAGVSLLDVYYCPHHDEKENCICRKPNSLMLEKAIARYDINRNESYFIGDSDRDMKAAVNAGVKGIKVIANSNLNSYLVKIK